MWTGFFVEKWRERGCTVCQFGGVEEGMCLLVEGRGGDKRGGTLSGT